MKSLILAAVAAVSLTTSAFALDTLSEVDKDKLIDQCAAKHTLDPNALTGLPDDQVIAKLQDCANGPDGTPVADSAPVSTTAQRFAAQTQADSVSPAPRRSSGGFSSASASSSDDSGASDAGSDADAGGSGLGGLGGLLGHHHHGDQDDGGGAAADTTATPGGNPGGTGGTATATPGTGGTGTAGTPGGTGGTTAPKLSTVQKDAVIGSGLKAGETKASVSSKNIGNGLKQVTAAQVTKNPDGTVTVKREVTTVNAQGATVGTPRDTNQKFTPADINVLKSANGTNPIGNAPTFAPKNGVNAAQNLHSAQHLSLRDRINQKMAAAGKPGATTKTSALDRFKQKLQAKSTNSTVAKSSVLDRFKQRQAAGKNSTVAKASLSDRFKKHAQTGKTSTASRFRQIHTQKTNVAQHVKHSTSKVASVSHHTAVRHALAHRLANKKVHLARK